MRFTGGLAVRHLSQTYAVEESHNRMGHRRSIGEEAERSEGKAGEGIEHADRKGRRGYGRAIHLTQSRGENQCGRHDVVKLCAKLGTHYVQINGEVPGSRP